MLKYLRYALATVCFAASLLFFAWSCRSVTCWDIIGVNVGSTRVEVDMYCGRCSIRLPQSRPRRWTWTTNEIDESFCIHNAQPPHFGEVTQFAQFREFRFPLWYPALIFALAGVAALRLGRRFTLRSAIIATTVVAGLLGMAVIL